MGSSVSAPPPVSVDDPLVAPEVKSQSPSPFPLLLEPLVRSRSVSPPGPVSLFRGGAPQAITTAESATVPNPIRKEQFMLYMYHKMRATRMRRPRILHGKGLQSQCTGAPGFRVRCSPGTVCPGYYASSLLTSAAEVPPGEFHEQSSIH